MAHSLPFNLRATVKNQAGEELATDVPIAVWPANRGVANATGMAYDHEGEAPISTYELFDAGNIRVEVGGREFIVIDREMQELVPHVTLLLRRVTARG